VETNKKNKPNQIRIGGIKENKYGDNKVKEREEDEAQRKKKRKSIRRISRGNR
jgi:hypothetical protein